MLLTLTNPVESVTHVTLAACDEDDPDDVNSTSKVFTSEWLSKEGAGCKGSSFSSYLNSYTQSQDHKCVRVLRRVRVSTLTLSVLTRISRSPSHSVHKGQRILPFFF